MLSYIQYLCVKECEKEKKNKRRKRQMILECFYTLQYYIYLHSYIRISYLYIHRPQYQSLTTNFFILNVYEILYDIHLCLFYSLLLFFYEQNISSDNFLFILYFVLYATNRLYFFVFIFHL